MLGVIPLHRKNAFTVTMCALWNLLVLSPFVIAYWLLTEFNSNPDGRNCGGMPFDAANFARWTFLGCAAYTIFAVPLNICMLRREEKLKGYRSHRWLRMCDALHWLVNWALWFYLIAALCNRDQCGNSGIRKLIWATVLASAGFALIGLIAGIAALSILIFKNIQAIEKAVEDRTAQGIDMLAMRVSQNDRMKQAVSVGGPVEVLDIRRAQAGNRVVDENAYVREAERKGDIENRGVLDKVHREVVQNLEKDEVPVTRTRREQNEPINIRDQPVREDIIIERTTVYQEPITLENSRHLRNLDPRAGKY